MRNMTRFRREDGFTLIELMITVALIGVLSAIAVPSFMSYQSKTRRSEAFVTLDGVATAFTAFYSEEGRYPDMQNEAPSSATALPLGAPTPSKVDWDGELEAFFDLVGFSVEGRIWHRYGVTSPENPTAGTCSCVECFTLAAQGDTDGDGQIGTVVYFHPQRDAAGAIVGQCPDVQTAFGPPVVNGSLVFDTPVAHPLGAPF